MNCNVDNKFQVSTEENLDKDISRMLVAQTTDNSWGAFQNVDPENTIFKTIIIFFWNLVVCSGFKKLNKHVPSELTVNFGLPHIYTGF